MDHLAGEHLQAAYLALVKDGAVPESIHECVRCGATWSDRPGAHSTVGEYVAQHSYHPDRCPVCTGLEPEQLSFRSCCPKCGSFYFEGMARRLRANHREQTSHGEGKRGDLQTARRARPQQ